MATWKLSNEEKKSVQEHSLWAKGDIKIRRVECYRWGSWTCESDDKPNIDLKNEDGLDIYSSGFEWELVSMDDGCWAEWDWGSLTDDNEKERIEALFDEDGDDGMEQDGWVNEDTEVWIFNELVIDKVDH